MANTHPDVALEIWQEIVEGLVGQVKPKAYEAAGVYLRLMEKVYERLADDGKVETYRILRGLLKYHQTRCRLLPGNQDDREHMRRVFPKLLATTKDP